MTAVFATFKLLFIEVRSVFVTQFEVFMAPALGCGALNRLPTLRPAQLLMVQIDS